MRKSKAIVEAASVPESYRAFLTELKERIQATQLRASASVNRELVLLYWQIGRDILDRQNRERLGAKVIDRLSVDLKLAFPELAESLPDTLKGSLSSIENLESELANSTMGLDNTGQ